MARDLDTPGGEYISVQILVNGNLVFMRDAVLSQIIGKAVREYKVDDSGRFTVPPKGTQDPVDFYKSIAERLLLPQGKR